MHKAFRLKKRRYTLQGRDKINIVAAELGQNTLIWPKTLKHP